MSDLTFYKNQPDYEEIEKYLDSSPIVLEEKDLPKFVPDYSNAVVVDGIPVVNQEKAPKLYTAILKVFSQVYNEVKKVYAHAAPITEADITMPFNPETGTSYGFCFIKFSSKLEAEKAISMVNGFELDKRHTFKVNAYGDLDYYGKISENDAPPTLPDFHPKPEVSSWLNEPLFRDEFAIRYGKETEIYWNNGSGEAPTLHYGAEREKLEGKHWCELTVEWSPLGTYFATFHKAGVKLWGGNEFFAQGRFMHPNVEEISFSPCERFLVTYRLNDLPGSNSQENIIIWDVRTGEKIKTFSKKSPYEAKFPVIATVTEEKNGKKVERTFRGRVLDQQENNYGLVYIIEEGSTKHEVPAKSVQATLDPNHLKWSPDGHYVARLSPDIISVYELPGERVYSIPAMNLLDKRSFAAKDVQDFSWSPKANLLAYWSPANGNYPAVINITKVPERDEVCTRKIVDVTDCKMVWQNDGDYLCVYMTKTSGKKKSYIVMFFRVKDSGIPVEQIELQEPIVNASWEPSGDRIALISGEARNPQISFYSMVNTAAPVTKGKNTAQTTTRNELTFLFTKTGTPCTELQWSPAGGVVSLAYFPGDACVFELFDVDANAVLASRKHDRGTKFVWDPTGRYVASATITELRNINARGQPDDGVNFYTFQGTLLSQFKREKVFGFSWRPRPRDYLKSEEKRNILKNLKKYEKEFERKDRVHKQELQQAQQQARYRVAEEFLQWRNRNRSFSAALKPRRVQLRGGYDSDDDHNYEIERKVRDSLFFFYSVLTDVIP